MSCTCQHIDLAHRYLCATQANTGHCLAAGCKCPTYTEEPA